MKAMIEIKDRDGNEIHFNPAPVWISFIVLAFSQFVVRFFRNSTGTLKASLSASLGVSIASLGNLSAFYFYPYTIMQIPAGYLADTFGSRIVIAAGMLLASVGGLIFSTAQSLTALYIGRVIIGFGVSVPVVAMHRFISKWFSSKRQGTFAGINVLIGNIGSVCAQLPLAMLIEKMSWRIAIGCVSFLAILVSLLAFTIAKESPEELLKRSDIRYPNQSKKENKVNILTAIWQVYSNPSSWPLMLMIFVYMGLNSVFSSTYAVPFLEDVFGMSTVEASSFTTLLTLGMMFSTMIVGTISDLLRSRKKMLLITSSGIVFTWAMFSFGTELLRSRAVLIAVMILHGLCFSTGSLIFCNAKELNNPEYYGTAVSSINTLGSISASVFPQLAGAIMGSGLALGLGAKQLYGRTFTVFFFISIVLVICAALITDSSGVNRYEELRQLRAEKAGKKTRKPD